MTSAEEAQRERFRQLREQIARTPPDERYRLEVAEWEGGGWT